MEQERLNNTDPEIKKAIEDWCDEMGEMKKEYENKKQLQEQMKGGVWIKASERLPGNSGWYFVRSGIDKALWTKKRLVARVEYLKKEGVNIIFEWLDESAFDELKEENERVTLLLIDAEERIGELELIIDAQPNPAAFDELIQQNQKLQKDFAVLQEEFENSVAECADCHIKISELQAEKEKLMSDYMEQQTLCQNNEFKKEI